MRVRQQSSTSHPVTFLMVDSTDHVTGKTGLTPTVTLSKDGGAFAAAAGAVSEIGNGWYALAGNATDRGTAGDLLIHASAAGADPVDERYLVVPWDPFDGAGLGLTDFDAVTLAATQPAVTFGQVKILANVSGEGALHVVNSNASGRGQHNEGGDTGQYNRGGTGQYNYGTSHGQQNYGNSRGQYNAGVYGQYNNGTTIGQRNTGPTPVDGVDAVGTRNALGMAAANLDTQLAAIGVDSQDVADAMKLAPSAGAAAAGSVQAKLGDGVDALEAALLAGLSGATVTVVSSVDGGLVLVYAADTWRFTVSSAALEALGLADYEVLGLVVKRDARQTDSQALLYLRTDTGLARIDGAAPASAANGTLTAGSGSFSGVVHVAETVGVTPGEYSWWLKGIDTTPTPDEAATLATGRFLVMPAGLQAVV